MRGTTLGNFVSNLFFKREPEKMVAPFYVLHG